MLVTVGSFVCRGKYSCQWFRRPSCNSDTRPFFTLNYCFSALVITVGMKSKEKRCLSVKFYGENNFQFKKPWLTEFSMLEMDIP